MRLKQEKEMRVKTGEEVIKLFDLNKKEGELRERLLREVDWSGEGVMEDMWNGVAECVRKCAKEVLGVKRKGKCKVDKESWWWGPVIQEVIRKKRTLYREWTKERGKNAWEI